MNRARKQICGGGEARMSGRWGHTVMALDVRLRNPGHQWKLPSMSLR